jgi:hypothetical protein
VRTFTREALVGELARARAKGWDRVCAEVEEEEGFPSCLLLAIASHETDMNDVVGDHGHGRGLFQIDDRSHGPFLTSQRAERAGGKPAVGAAARYAATLLKQNLDFGRRKRVRQTDLFKFAVSAYNAGPGGALEGYRLGDSDRKTTPGNYARDVMGRMAVFQELVNGVDEEPLRRGTRGPAVAALRAALSAWYARHLPGEWERLRVGRGPVFGAALERAVVEFQRSVGLKPDGVVGAKTRRALDQGRAPKRQARTATAPS